MLGLPDKMADVCICIYVCMYAREAFRMSQITALLCFFFFATQSLDTGPNSSQSLARPSFFRSLQDVKEFPSRHFSGWKRKKRDK